MDEFIKTKLIERGFSENHQEQNKNLINAIIDIVEENEKREYFSCKAMQGYCVGEITGDEKRAEKIAIWSVQMADALIQQLKTK